MVSDSDFGLQTSVFGLQVLNRRRAYVVGPLQTYFRQFLDSGQTSDIRLRISVFRTNFIGLHQTLDFGLRTYFRLQTSNFRFPTDVVLQTSDKYRVVFRLRIYFRQTWDTLQTSDFTLLLQTLDTDRLRTSDFEFWTSDRILILNFRLQI